MTAFDLVWRGLVAGLVIAAPVGPVNVFCIRQTLAKGWKAGLLAGLGAAAGDTLYGAIAAFSITVILRFLVAEQHRLRWWGGLMLLAVGIAYFCKRPALFDAAEPGTPGYSAAASTFLLNLTNPTAVLSFLAVLAALGLAYSKRWWLTTLLVGGIFCGSMAWWILLSAVVNCFRGRLNLRAALYMNRAAGLAIGGFGVILMVLSRARP